MQKERVRKNCLSEQPRKQVSEMHFDKTPQSFDIPVLGNELQDCSCCDFLTEAMLGSSK